MEIADKMAGARPTAVNLRWAVERMCLLMEEMATRSVEEIKQVLRQESEKILAEDIEINRRIGKNGQSLIPKEATILTHCNAGSLATGGYGTALGVIRAAHAAGKKVEVIADETRPLLQGLRLTAFELMEDGLPVTVIADNAAGSFMRQKKVDLIITATSTYLPSYADIDPHWFTLWLGWTAEDPNPDDEGGEFTSGLVEDINLIIQDPAQLQEVLEAADAQGENPWVVLFKLAFITAKRKDVSFLNGDSDPQMWPK